MNDRERLNDVQCILADDLKELIAEYFEKMYPSANHLLAMQLAFYLADHGVTVQKHGRHFAYRCPECNSSVTDFSEREKPRLFPCPRCGTWMNVEDKHD